MTTTLLLGGRSARDPLEGEGVGKIADAMREEYRAIVDAALERIPDPATLAARLALIPGVVEHGLFVGIAQAAIIADPTGVQILEHS